MRESVIAALVATKKWSEGTARIFERAGHKCEYCGFDFLASVDALKLMEVDHIIPLSKGGDPANLENLAIACRHCNFYLKRNWDPRSALNSSPHPREDLIAAVRQHVEKLRKVRESWLNEVRQIVGDSRVL